MADLLKLLFFLALAVFAWFFLQRTVGDSISWNNLFTLGTNRSVVISDEELWANPSPHRDWIHFDTLMSTPTADMAQYEYLRIDAGVSNTGIVDLSGWSVESIVSKTRMYLPPAVLLLKMAGPNETSPVVLAPGEYAYIHSHGPPVGASFHTNTCTGYLSQFNDFIPKLPQTCTSPATLLPATVENIRAYGGECIDFLQQASSCTTYVTAMPAELLPACRELVARKLNYNTCLSDAHKADGFDIFNNGGWRLYLNNSGELWANSYETIRLLDAQGRTVDVLRY